MHAIHDAACFTATIDTFGERPAVVRCAGLDLEAEVDVHGFQHAHPAMAADGEHDRPMIIFLPVGAPAVVACNRGRVQAHRLMGGHGGASRTAVLVCQGRAVAHGRIAIDRFDDPTAMMFLRADERGVVEWVRGGVPPRGWGRGSSSRWCGPAVR